MVYNFDTIIDRSGTGSIKWDRYSGKDIIPLWVADMDFVSPSAVMDALVSRVEHGVFGYTHTPDKLRQIVIDMLAQKYNWQVEADWLIWLPGLVTGLNIVCRVTNPDADILSVLPIYPPFLSAPVNSGRNLVTMPLEFNGDKWVFDYSVFENTITAKTEMFLFCNPHNPTGRIYNAEELGKIAEMCAKHDLLICSDEIHCDLLLDEEKQHIPIASISADIAQRTITLMAPSKTYNIAGLGCSYAIIPDAILRNKFKQAMAGIVPHVNLLGYCAAQAAYSEGQEWLEALLQYLRQNRNMLESFVETLPGVKMAHVEATYLGWLDVRGLNLESPAKYFESYGIGLSDGAEFGAPGFLRLNFGCSAILLKEAFARMEKAVRNVMQH